jgi:hypothetical protein
MAATTTIFKSGAARPCSPCEKTAQNFAAFMRVIGEKHASGYNAPAGREPYFCIGSFLRSRATPSPLGAADPGGPEIFYQPTRRGKRDPGHDIVQALDVLDVERREHVAAVRLLTISATSAKKNSATTFSGSAIVKV